MSGYEQSKYLPQSPSPIDDFFQLHHRLLEPDDLVFPHKISAGLDIVCSLLKVAKKDHEDNNEENIYGANADDEKSVRGTVSET